MLKALPWPPPNGAFIPTMEPTLIIEDIASTVSLVLNIAHYFD